MIRQCVICIIQYDIVWYDIESKDIISNVVIGYPIICNIKSYDTIYYLISWNNIVSYDLITHVLINSVSNIRYEIAYIQSCFFWDDVILCHTINMILNTDH